MKYFEKWMVGAVVGMMAILRMTPLAEGSGPPNFVFILADDQGWAETAFQMHPDIVESCSAYLETPNLERLARAGMRFSNGYAPAPLCTPTRRSVLTGQTPARLRGTEFPCDPPDYFDPAQHLTIPKALKAVDARYRCAHFGKWGELIPAPELAGYDVSDGRTGNNTGGGMGAEDGGKLQDVVAPTPKEDPKLVFSMTRRAMDFMEQQVRDGKPFYVQVSHYAAHHQIQARAATIEKYRAKGTPPRDFPLEWAAMLDDMDTGIGQLLDKLDALGVADNTYVFFSADNGGAPHEKQSPIYLACLGGEMESRPAPESRLPENYPLRGAKQWLYEGGIRVPFIVRGPGVKPGTFSSTPVAQYDLLPTLVDLAGGRVPLPEDIDGGSLRAVLLNAGQGDVKRNLPGLIFHRPKTGFSALRSGDFKLVVRWPENRKELYNLAQDISEQKDLAAVMPEKTDALFTVLTNYLTAVNAEQYDPSQKSKKDVKKARRQRERAQN